MHRSTPQVVLKFIVAFGILKLISSASRLGHKDVIPGVIGVLCA
jgi:hypothetical protein